MTTVTAIVFLMKEIREGLPSQSYSYITVLSVIVPAFWKQKWNVNWLHLHSIRNSFV